MTLGPSKDGALKMKMLGRPPVAEIVEKMSKAKAHLRWTGFGVSGFRVWGLKVLVPGSGPT